VLSGGGLCDGLVARPGESCRLCCVVVCDLETSGVGAPCMYDIGRLRLNASITALCDSHWLTWWSRSKLLSESVWVPYRLSRIWEGGYKHWNWLQCAVSTDERFIEAFRMGNGTPRYLYNLSNVCSVCVDGRTEMCVPDVTDQLHEQNPSWEAK